MPAAHPSKLEPPLLSQQKIPIEKRRRQWEILDTSKTSKDTSYQNMPGLAAPRIPQKNLGPHPRFFLSLFYLPWCTYTYLHIRLVLTAFERNFLFSSFFLFPWGVCFIKLRHSSRALASPLQSQLVRVCVCACGVWGGMGGCVIAVTQAHYF